MDVSVDERPVHVPEQMKRHDEMTKVYFPEFHTLRINDYWRIRAAIHFRSFFSSDGAGRSGVYLAIDSNIELCEEDGVFDVYGYLKKMRSQRRGLVETLVSRLALVLSRFTVTICQQITS